MKSLDKKTIIVAASTLALGLLFGWLLFGGTKESTHNEHQHTKTEVKGETIWTCSMHPQVRQPEPGDCPICGMDLIPLEEDKNTQTDPNAIRMSPTAMQLANVSTTVVGSIKPQKQVRLNGKVQSDERMVYSQASHIPGRIEKLMVNFTGEFVQKGQAIAYVYSPELVTAQEELLEAQRISEAQPQLFSSAKEKLKRWKLTDKQIAEVLSTGKTMDEFPILADVSGYVTSKLVNLGSYVRKGETIYQIADLSKVWVLFDVYESDITWVKKGDKIDFTIASLPGESFVGTVSYLDPTIDPKTRVAKARVEYSNTTNKLKPEMFASGVVEATLTGKSKSLVVPKTAVMWTGKRSVVYVKVGSSQGVDFSMREVTLGPSLGDSYIVESGLMDGEEIAVNGTFSIDAAAQLAGKPSMMSPEGGAAVSGHNHGSAPSNQLHVDEHSKEAPKNLTISKEAKRTLEPLYIAYLEWKDELTNDNFDKAQKKAENMKLALEKVDITLFKGDTHTAWMNAQSQLSNGLQHVMHQSNIKDLRETFRLVSTHMVELTTMFNPFPKTLFVQHCPMANSNKGADWLSTQKEIRNPYFGSSMLTCGEVTKEIN